MSKDTYAASFSCANAARFFAMAYAFERCDGAATAHAEMALDDLRRAANAMGFQLIQIKEPVEAQS